MKNRKKRFEKAIFIIGIIFGIICVIVSAAMTSGHVIHRVLLGFSGIVPIILYESAKTLFDESNLDEEES